MWSAGRGCSATQAPTKPRNIHAKREKVAARIMRPTTVSRIPVKTNEPAIRNPATRKEREVAYTETGGQRPRTMPQRKAAAIATAGSFTEHASGGPVSRCEKSAERDRTGASG